MNPEMRLHERLAALEEKAEKQEAQIDALVRVLSDTLAAHAVLHKDVRLFSFIKEYREGDRKKEEHGGTSHWSASHFAARGDLFATILEEATNSPVLDNYWYRSIFWRREVKQRAALENVRKAIEAKRDG